MFLFVFSTLLALIHLYVGIRTVHSTRVPWPQSAAAWGGCALLLASIPATFFLIDRKGAPVLVFQFVAYLWLGCVFYLWTIFLASDACRGAISVLRAALRRQEPPADPARRAFLARAVAGGAALATAGLAGAGVRGAYSEIATPEIGVRLARLPAALDGFHVVQLSDLHVGPLLGERFVRAVVEQTNRLRPDLIVVTGDLVDGSVRALGPAVGALSRLRARSGVFFVTGNHEYYSGCDPWTRYLESLGVVTLMNRRVSVGDAAGASFDLLGVPDHHAGHYHAIAPDMRRAARGRDEERELVVLAHQPVQLAQARAVSAGLQLSGHTHGGQLQPFGHLVALVQPYVAGLHREGATQIYVSRGTGFWGPPMRVAAPAEITSLRLISG